MAKSVCRRSADRIRTSERSEHGQQRLPGLPAERRSCRPVGWVGLCWLCWLRCWVRPCCSVQSVRIVRPLLMGDVRWVSGRATGWATGARGPGSSPPPCTKPMGPYLAGTRRAARHTERRRPRPQRQRPPTTAKNPPKARQTTAVHSPTMVEQPRLQRPGPPRRLALRPRMRLQLLLLTTPVPGGQRSCPGPSDHLAARCNYPSLRVHVHSTPPPSNSSTRPSPAAFPVDALDLSPPWPPSPGTPPSPHRRARKHASKFRHASPCRPG